MSKSNRIKLAGVWKREMDNGTVYWKGKATEYLSVCLFKNTSDHPNSPDLDVVLIQSSNLLGDKEDSSEG